jgi:hypothetical protein
MYFPFERPGVRMMLAEIEAIVFTSRGDFQQR